MRKGALKFSCIYQVRSSPSTPSLPPRQTPLPPLPPPTALTELLATLKLNNHILLNSFQTLRANYSPNISAGAWTIYKITEFYAWDQIDDVVDRLTKNGAQRLITDDVSRLLRKLGRQVHTTTKPMRSTSPARASLVVARTFMLVFIIFLSLY